LVAHTGSFAHLELSGPEHSSLEAIESCIARGVSPVDGTPLIPKQRPEGVPDLSSEAVEGYLAGLPVA
jgi:hypothetical protein